LIIIREICPLSLWERVRERELVKQVEVLINTRALDQENEF
jgi:hypothetical protein